MRGVAIGLLLASAIATVVMLTSGAEADVHYVDGPWYITESTTLADGAWYVNGSVYVESGTLTLDDAVLSLEPAYPSQQSIVIGQFGRMNASNSTIDGCGIASITVRNDTLLRNTTLTGLMVPLRNDGCIRHEAGELVLDGCTLEGNVGLVILSCSDLVVRGCTFIDFASGIQWSAYDYWGQIGPPQMPTLLVEGTLFSGPEGGPTGGALHILDGFPFPVQNDHASNGSATVRGCTFERVEEAFHAPVQNASRTYPVLFEGNTVRDSVHGAFLYDSVAPVTVRNDTYSNISQQALFVVASGNGSLVCEGETVRGAMTGLWVLGDDTFPTVTIRGLNVSGSTNGVRVEEAELDLEGSDVSTNFCDFDIMMEGGKIHLHGGNLDPSAKMEWYTMAEVVGFCGTRIYRVGWHDGPSIERGVVTVLPELGLHEGRFDIGVDRMLWLPVWYRTPGSMLDIREVRGELNVSGHAFHTDAIDPLGPLPDELDFRDDFVPVLEVMDPQDGSLIASDSIFVNGRFEEFGSGIDAFLARIDDGPWTRVTWIADGIWAVEFADVPEGLHSLKVVLVDKVGNTATVQVAHVITDSTVPFIRVVSEFGWMRYTPAVLVAETEPNASVLVNGEPVPVDPQGRFTKRIDLALRANIVRIVVTDRVGNRNETELVIWFDNYPPLVAILEPSEGEWLSTMRVHVVGRVENGTSVLVNGHLADTQGEQFSCDLPVDEGTVLINVTATDPAGNFAIDSRVVHVDRTPPKVYIENPQDGQATKEFRTAVECLVDEVGLANVTLGDGGMDLNGSVWRGTTTLHEGWNDIVVGATDLAGNAGEARVRVLLDTHPPTLSVTLRVGGTELLPGASAWSTGEGVATLDMEVDERSSIFVSDVGRHDVPPGRTSIMLGLLPDTNLISVLAIDSVGNAAPGVSFLVVRDVRPPVLALREPANGIVVDGDHIRVNGTTEPGASVTVNGVAVKVDSDGSFTVDIGLEEGSNVIVVVATDTVGNAANATVRVTSRPPVVEPPQAEGPRAPMSAWLFVGLLAVVVYLLAMSRNRTRQGRRPGADGRTDGTTMGDASHDDYPVKVRRGG